MNLTEEEKQRVENFLLFLIAKKEQQSGGHNGFSLHDLSETLSELEEQGRIVQRPNPTKTMYFIKSED